MAQKLKALWICLWLFVPWGSRTSCKHDFDILSPFLDLHIKSICQHLHLTFRSSKLHDFSKVNQQKGNSSLIGYPRYYDTRSELDYFPFWKATKVSGIQEILSNIWHILLFVVSGDFFPLWYIRRHFPQSERNYRQNRSDNYEIVKLLFCKIICSLCNNTMICRSFSFIPVVFILICTLSKICFYLIMPLVFHNILKWLSVWAVIHIIWMSRLFCLYLMIIYHVLVTNLILNPNLKIVRWTDWNLQNI